MIRVYLPPWRCVGALGLFPLRTGSRSRSVRYGWRGGCLSVRLDRRRDRRTLRERGGDRYRVFHKERFRRLMGGRVRGKSLVGIRDRLFESHETGRWGRGRWERGRWGGGRRGRGRRERCWNHRRSRRRHRLPRSVQSSFGPVLDNLNARFDAVGERHIPPPSPQRDRSRGRCGEHSRSGYTPLCGSCFIRFSRVIRCGTTWDRQGRG